jgi:uncharacterized membrane protein YedE/YeeE
MSYQQFVLAYQKGTFGCTIQTVPALKLFIAGEPEPRIARAALTRWLFEFLCIIGVSIGLSIRFSAIIGLLFAVVGLSVLSLIFIHQVAEMVLDCSLANDHFFETAIKDQALIVLIDDEENLPAVENVVAMPVPPKKKASGS